MSLEYDYYKILEIPRFSGLSAIKKAYREKAKLYHPDINNNPKANEYFLVVNDAHATLSDPVRKMKYDEGLRKIYHETRRKARQQQRTVRPTGPRWEPKKTGEYKSRLVIYNLLFVCGILLGVLHLSMSLYLGFVVQRYTNVALILLFPGMIFIRDGWLGLTWKGGLYSLKAFNWFRKSAS